MANTHLPPQWRERLLALVNAHGALLGQFAPEMLRLLDAWQRAEGGSAKWNPLNTTYRLTGSVSYNRSSVQSYFRQTEGVCAAALTLVNGLYPGILGDLQGGGKTAEQVVKDRRLEFAKWGTNPDLILTLLAEGV